MTYRFGDYVYPSDLRRPFLCRVVGTAELRVRAGYSQLLKLQPLEGPWPSGTVLVRMAELVHDAGRIPARLRARPSGQPHTTA